MIDSTHRRLSIFAQSLRCKPRASRPGDPQIWSIAMVSIAIIMLLIGVSQLFPLRIMPLDPNPGPRSSYALSSKRTSGSEANPGSIAEIPASEKATDNDNRKPTTNTFRSDELDKLQPSVRVIDEVGSQQRRKMLVHEHRALPKARQPRDIDALLAQAKLDLRASRLTTATDNNAWERLQAVLILDPGNLKAREGLQDIFFRYVKLAKHAKTAGNLRTAAAYLKRAKLVLFGSP